MAKGFTQNEGINYTEIFSPLVKPTSIGVIISLVAQYDLELHQIDVTTSFHHGDLEETIYMKQLKGLNKENIRYAC